MSLPPIPDNDDSSPRIGQGIPEKLLQPIRSIRASTILAKRNYIFSEESDRLLPTRYWLVTYKDSLQYPNRLLEAIINPHQSKERWFFTINEPQQTVNLARRIQAELENLIKSLDRLFE